MTVKENNKLFAFNPKEPMKFTILQGKMLQIKCKQYIKKIENHGGIFIHYDDKDDECIVLTHRTQSPMKVEMFDIRYVKDCIIQNKVLNLQDYRISLIPKYSTTSKKIATETSNNSIPNINGNKEATCIFAAKVLNDEKCIHKIERSAKIDLEIIKKEFT